MKLGISKKTRILSYGIKTEQGSFYTEQAIVYGTNISAGVQPGAGGQKYLGVDVFDTIKEAVKKKSVDVCVIYGSKKNVVSAIFEALEVKIKIIVCMVGGIPVLDMVKVKEKLQGSGSILIGPSSLGLIIPSLRCKIGVIPDKIASKGNVGLITRHGSLTFAILNQLSSENLGLSTAISLGSEVIKGMDLVNAFKEMVRDNNTKIVVILANISGFDEENLADYYSRLDNKYKKPVVIYMAGSFYDFKGKATYQEKVLGEKYLNSDEKKLKLYKAGMTVLESPAIIAKTVKSVLNKNV